jgi:branched-chain amino acid transport system substrate-binding protein
MSYESTAEPIKIGYLFDFRLPEGYPQEMRDDLTRPFDLVFVEGLVPAHKLHGRYSGWRV